MGIAYEQVPQITFGKRSYEGLVKRIYMHFRHRSPSIMQLAMLRMTHERQLKVCNLLERNVKKHMSVSQRCTS